jgi:N-acetylmuramoyl-L-alanine amidase CwlA
MKQYKFILFVAFALLLLVGCNGKKEPISKNNNLDKISDWVKENTPTAICEDYTFPKTHPTLGGTITWESLDPSVLSSDGEIVIVDGVEDVVITYTIKLNGHIKANTLIIKVSSFTIDEAAEEFASQFKTIINRDYTIDTNLIDGFTFTWSSDNQDIFNNEGKFTKPVNDTLITISYSVTFNGVKKDYTKEVTAKGPTYSEKIAELQEWVETNYLPQRYIESKLTLPTRYEKFGIDINWTSSNTGVINSKGEVKQYAFDRYVTLIGETTIDGFAASIDFSLVVAAKPTTTKEEKINSLLEAIAVPEIGKLAFNAYPNINQSYNFLPFYQNVDAPVYNYIIPVNSDSFDGSRPGTKLYSLEFITIHDTANTNSNGLAHAKLLLNGYSASWHYCIDDTGAYQSIPLDEVAWHAGDGSRPFGLNDTGVKATVKYPKITITTDGYYAFNGTKSKIQAPKAGTMIATTSQITPSGIYTEIGPNGNYYINNSYYNDTYNKISNAGGNRNSIGIETSIHNGSDYAQTLRYTAKICGKILSEHNLSADRVLQHNNFSGKYCPNAIRSLNYWNNFLDLVSMEIFAQSELSDVTFTWTSQSSILDNNGKIALDLNGINSVAYAVNATDGTINIDKTFITKIK